jgi:CMP-N,N'-diacetyllegionaminic acid synthase
MKILGVIPARGGSKGVHKKNIKKLGDFPLIYYAINASQKSFISDVIVSTDSIEIKSIAEHYGATVPFLRPDEIASDSSSSVDVALHALNTYEEITNCKYDALMLLQPTTPFRTSEDINAAINMLKNNPDVDSIISVVDVEATHPARMKFMKDNFLIDPPFVEKKENQNRQELETMYIRNGAIYLTKASTIRNKSFKGNKSLGLVMSKFKSINIDTIEDFEYAEFLATR